MLKRPAENVNHERWLGSYANLVTLLFALFVVLYASSKADVEKYKKLADAVKAAPEPAAGLAFEKEFAALSGLLEDSLKESLDKNALTDKLIISQDSRGLLLRLSVEGFYEKGSAEVKSQATEVLDQIANILKTVEHPIRVEGHTDNGKISSEYFPSNWELSTARASRIVRFFIQQHSFNPKQLTAAGYAEFHPVAENTSEEGRAKNRRVEILVLREEPK